jgi:uncharacterized membrane-anchored protein YitT (DUF2179 family)
VAWSRLNLAMTLFIFKSSTNNWHFTGPEISPPNLITMSLFYQWSSESIDPLYVSIVGGFLNDSGMGYLVILLVNGLLWNRFSSRSKNTEAYRRLFPKEE